MDYSVTKNWKTGYEIQAGSNVSIKHARGMNRNFRNVIVQIENVQRNGENQVTKTPYDITFSNLELTYRETFSGTGPGAKSYSVIQIIATISEVDGQELKLPINFTVHGKKRMGDSGFNIKYFGHYIAPESLKEWQITCAPVLAALQLAREKLDEKKESLEKQFAQAIEAESEMLRSGNDLRISEQYRPNLQEINLGRQHLQKRFLDAIIGNGLARS